MSNTILVTGASGLLGANFVLTAKQRSSAVVALSYHHSLTVAGSKAVQADLTDRRTSKEIVLSFRPSWIVHCAALTNVDWCEAHPGQTSQGNVEMTRNLAVVAREVDAGFVYISTDSVFDGQIGNYSEESTPAPLNVYARSKLEGEKVVQNELDSGLIIRTNIYGWNALEKMSLAEWILHRLEAGQIVPGFRDVVFTPIVVNDLCEIVLDMMEMGLKGIYHVAGSQVCSKYEFALGLAEVFGLNTQLVQAVSVSGYPFIAPRPRNTSLLTSKVSRVVGRPMPDVRSGLRCFRTLRANGYLTELEAMRGA